MARPSFGGDLFSPILSDSPSNVGDLNERNSGRGSISEILRKPSPLLSTQREDFKKESRRNNIPKRNLFPSEKVQIQRAASSYSEIQIKSVERLEEKIIEFGTESTKVLPSSKKEVSKSSRRNKNKEGQNKSDVSETDRVSRHVSNKSASSKASRKKDSGLGQSKFITLTRGSNSKREEEGAACPKITATESVEEKENNENSRKSCEKVSIFNCSREKISTQVRTKPTLEPTQKFDANVFPTAGGNLKPEEKTQVPPNLFNEASQIQGQILEKLINDTVSNKFMDIRMQLHHMHLSLLTGFGERLDEMEKSNEIMFKIIGQLLEENQQLRNMVSMHR